MRIGPRFKVPCCKIDLDGNSLNWVSSIRHLGITIRSAKGFSTCHLEAKQNFYKASNGILHCLGSNPNISLTLNLLYKIAIPMLTYGIGALSLRGTELSSLCFAFNSLTCKLFKIKKISHIRLTQYFSSCFEAEHLLNYLRLGFLLKQVNNGKLIISCPLDEPDLEDFNDLLTLYGVNVNDSRNLIKFKIWEKIKLSLLTAGILP